MRSNSMQGRTVLQRKGILCRRITNNQLKPFEKYMLGKSNEGKKEQTSNHQSEKIFQGTEKQGRENKTSNQLTI